MARRIKDSWIREYLRYTENTESPSMFHLWVGISTIASVVDRDIYVNQGFFKIYPNLYIILVAGSQECRKSTAINIGESLLRNLPKSPEHSQSKDDPRIFHRSYPAILQNRGLWHSFDEINCNYLSTRALCPHR